MSIHRGLKFFQVFLVISLCFVSLTTLTFKGYCDEWVLLGNEDNDSIYYDKTNITINPDNKQIKVWVKFKYTEKGKQDLYNKLKDKRHDITSYRDLNHELDLYSFDFKNMKYKRLSGIIYSNSEVIDSFKNSNTEWEDIVPESLSDGILNGILRDYNIQK